MLTIVKCYSNPFKLYYSWYKFPARKIVNIDLPIQMVIINLYACPAGVRMYEAKSCVSLISPSLEGLCSTICYVCHLLFLS